MVDSPLLQFYENQQDQNYRNALLQMNQRNQALQQQQMAMTLQNERRKQQAQALIGGQLSNALRSPGGGVPFGGLGPQQPQPAAPAAFQGPTQVSPPPQTMMAAGGALPLAQLQQQVLNLEGNKDYAIGKAGELGPGQIKPATGAEYGFKPDQLYGDSGRKASGAIVGDLYRQSGGDPAATLVGYNAGPGAMRKFKESGDDPNSVKLAPPYRNAVMAELTDDQRGQASDIAISAAGRLPPPMVGQAPPSVIQRLVQSVAGADADDDVKGAALMTLLPLMSQEGQQQFQHMYEMLNLGEREADRAQTRQMQMGEFREREADRSAQMAQTRELAEERMAETRDLTQARLQQGDERIGLQKQKLDAAQPPQMSDTDKKFWAQVIANGGSLPPGISRTAAGSKMVQEIMALVPGMTSGSAGNLIAQQGSQKANSHSLMNMTKMADAATSFERTANLNFDKALSLSKGAVPTNWGPYLNKWIEDGETQAGNKDVPPYVAAMLTAANEYAKIMSGSTGSQGSTVDSRREAAELFSPYLSAGQIERVVGIAKADMANREQSLYGQIGDIKQRLQGGGEAAPAINPQSQSAPQQGGGDIVPVPHAFANDPDGTSYQKDDGTWVKKGDKLVKTPGAVPTNGRQ